METRLPCENAMNLVAWTEPEDKQTDTQQELKTHFKYRHSCAWKQRIWLYQNLREVQQLNSCLFCLVAPSSGALIEQTCGVERRF